VERDDVEAKAALFGERSRFHLGRGRVCADAETEIQALGVVAEIDERIPESQAVLPARDRDQHSLLVREHVFTGHGSLDVALKEEDEAGLTKSGVVTPQLHHCLFGAALALHKAPPDITARTSMES